MAINFSMPDNDTNYADHFGYVRDNIQASVKMDYSGGTNIPTGAIRWNVVSEKFERMNSSGVWANLSSTFNVGTDITVPGSIFLGSTARRYHDGNIVITDSIAQTISGKKNFQSVAGSGTGLYLNNKAVRGGLNVNVTALESGPWNMNTASNIWVDLNTLPENEYVWGYIGIFRDDYDATTAYQIPYYDDPASHVSVYARVHGLGGLQPRIYINRTTDSITTGTGFSSLAFNRCRLIVFHSSAAT